MKAIHILKIVLKDTIMSGEKEYINEAIKEIEDLQNENKSLVKTLEKYNKEMINLRKENQELKKGIKC